MIIANFFENSKGNIASFTISGHAFGDEYGKDIICAAVSAMSYMTANTITEVLHCKAKVKVDEGYLSLTLSNEDAETAKFILEGFNLQMNELRKQYPNNIQIKRGVENA